MLKKTKNKQLIISVIALAVILGIGFFGADRPPLAQAGTSHNVSGFAWSGTIGWISFNCTDTNTCGTVDYGVNIDPTTGVFSGFGWFENIGWIAFAPVGVTPDGTVNPAKLNLTTNQVSGWAKAVAGGSPGSGGWDGWIKMSGTAGSGSYAVKRNGCGLEGYAWGSDVVGWIEFKPSFGGVILSGSICTGPTATLTADPSTINSGDSSTLTWTTANNPDSCAASGAWSGSKSAGGGFEPVSPILDSTYTITCSKAGFGDVSASAAINVSEAENQPPTANAGGNRTLNENQSIAINGSGSDIEDDANNISLTYSWTGSGAVYLSSNNIPSPTFLAPEVLSNTSFNLTLTVTDSGGLSNSNAATITVLDATPAPTFSFNPSSVSLNGSMLCQSDQTYNSSFITAIPQNGFNSEITLSVELRSGTLPLDVTYGLTDDVLISSEYSTGFKFWINVPASVCQPIEDVIFRVLGNGGESSAQVEVNIGSISPTFREI